MSEKTETVEETAVNVSENGTEEPTNVGLSLSKTSWDYTELLKQAGEGERGRELTGKYKEWGEGEELTIILDGVTQIDTKDDSGESKKIPAIRFVAADEDGNPKTFITAAKVLVNNLWSYCEAVQLGKMVKAPMVDVVAVGWEKAAVGKYMDFQIFQRVY